MKIKGYTIFGLAVASLLAGLSSCNSNAFSFIAKKSAWEVYSDKLSSSGLAQTETGRLWLEAADRAITNPPELPTPFSAKGFFKAREVRALAWQFDAQRGSTVRIDLAWKAMGGAKVFIDIFENLPERKRLASFSSLDSLPKYEFKKSGSYILRLQPELMAEGTFTLTVKKEATYAVFPVYGKDAKAVQSFWGATRGGGSRKHEGIDIFASRGTPVLAPVNGVVGAVRDRGLGGKQVWLRDTERGFNLYFAHLDSQAVSFGQMVKPGDTLGFVGNTGNAKFTPPHLHFGIYANGAFDPFPMVDNRLKEPEEANLAVVEEMLVVNAPKANFRKGPGPKFAILNDFEKNVPVQVLSGVNDWYHVETPEGIRGYIYSSLLSNTTPSKLSVDSGYVFPDPFRQPLDSFLIKTASFVSVGNYGKFNVISDSLNNVYYLSE